MVQVRSTTTKPMLVRGRTVVNVFKELQVSLFPEAKHTVVVQLTSDIWGFLNNYFFPLRSAISAELLGGPHKTGLSDGTSFATGMVGEGTSSRNTTADSSSDEEHEAGISGNADHGRVDGHTSGESCAYLKYCRIGEVDLELTTVGFPKKYGVALDRGLKLNSPSFHRSERIVSWKQLGRKYIKHMVSSFVRGQPKAKTSSSSLESLNPAAAASTAVAAGSSVLQLASSAVSTGKGTKELKGSATSARGREQRESLLFGGKKEKPKQNPQG